MANRKNKLRLNYALLAVVIYLFIPSLTQDELIPQETPVKHKAKIQAESIDTAPISSKKITILKSNDSYQPYMVKPSYPKQDVFDDNLCNLDDIRINYKPELKKAIVRLDPQYKHYLYNITEYLELNVYASVITKYFEEELNERIRILHQNYIEMLGVSAKRKITLNIVIAPQRSDYLHYISFYSPELNTSLGVYFGGLNIAFVDYQNSDENALKTAIHESVHILNAHIIGKTPHMFSEGMAELYENMRVKEGKAEVIILENQLLKETYPIMQFFDDEQWNDLETSRLYYSSWAWVTFMYSNKSRLNSLIYFMKKEQANPCSSFSFGETYSIFQEIYSMFETDFTEWQQNLSNRSSEH